MLKKLANNQSGATIVELLISVAVLGAVLVGGYSIATRSLNGVQIAKERTEALRLAEGQIEQIRGRVVAASSINDPSIAGFIGGNFCIDGSGNAISDPAQCSFGPDGRYTVRTEYDGAATVSAGPISGKTIAIFDVTVSWPRSGGGPDESLTLAYRAILDGVAP